MIPCTRRFSHLTKRVRLQLEARATGGPCTPPSRSSIRSARSIARGGHALASIRTAQAPCRKIDVKRNRRKSTGNRRRSCSMTRVAPRRHDLCDWSGHRCLVRSVHSPSRPVPAEDNLNAPNAPGADGLAGRTDGVAGRHPGHRARNDIPSRSRAHREGIPAPPGSPSGIPFGIHEPHQRSLLNTALPSRTQRE